MNDHQEPMVHSQAPLPATTGETKPGLINPHDVEDWKTRFNTVLADTSKISAPGPADAQPWTSAFFGCCTPIDACLLTYCLPCVTFGKIHHRTRKNASMEGYEAINTSCLLFLASACVGLHWIPESLQRSDIRAKYNLQGNCLQDIAIACCCALCDLTQTNKETEIREQELAKNGAGMQYSNAGATMDYKN